jgi:hypothetical protein
MPKLTDQTELTSLADNDLAHVVDVSDTTSGANGTSKKITYTNIFAQFLAVARTMSANFQYLQPVNVQTGTTYTLAADDYAKLITINNASPVTITLPQQSTTPTTTGFFGKVRNLGVGAINFVKEGAETLDGNTTLNQFGEVLIERPTTTKWSIAYGTALKPSQIEAARVPSAPVAGTTYVLVAKAKDPFTITGFVQQATSLATAGTYTININGVAVTGLSAVANTTAITETAATALNSVSVGDQVTIVFAAIATPVAWVGSLSILQTF